VKSEKPRRARVPIHAHVQPAPVAPVGWAWSQSCSARELLLGRDGGQGHGRRIEVERTEGGTGRRGTLGAQRRSEPGCRGSGLRGSQREADFCLFWAAAIWAINSSRLAQPLRYQQTAS
jgi:hypothetical protein